MVRQNAQVGQTWQLALGLPVRSSPCCCPLSGWCVVAGGGWVPQAPQVPTTPLLPPLPQGGLLLLTPLSPLLLLLLCLRFGVLLPLLLPP